MTDNAGARPGLAIYDGRLCVGGVVERKLGKVDALGPNGHQLGSFATIKLATDAVLECHRKAMGCKS